MWSLHGKWEVAAPRFLSFAGGLLGGSLLLGTLLGSGQSLLLGTFLTGFGLGNAACVLTGSRLGSRFLAGQFLGTFPGSLLSCLPLGFRFGTGFGTGHFFGNELLNLGVQGGVLLTLLGNDALDGLLLLLQGVDHLLLFGLLAFQILLLLLTSI